MFRRAVSILLVIGFLISILSITHVSVGAVGPVISYHVGPFNLSDIQDGFANVEFDGNTYYYSDDFDPGNIGSKLPALKNQNVVYELHNSYIVRVYTIDEVLYPKITVSHSDLEELYYKDGKFSQNSFDLQVSITPQLSDQFANDDLLWFLTDVEIERLYLNLKGLKITTPYGADFGSSGFAFWKSYTDEINESYNDDIKVNETKTYRYTVNLRNDKVLSQTEYTMDFDVTPKFDFGDGSTKTAKIQIVNLDEYAAIAEVKKASSPSGKAEKAAADTLSLKGNLVTASTTWNNFFTSEQSRLLDEFAYVWVSDLILAEIIDYSQFNLKTELAKKVQQEVLSKLGIDEKIITTGTKLSGSVNLLAETKDGTEVLVNYVADLSSFKFGLFSSDRPFGVTGQLKLSVYRISDGSQMGMTETVVANYTDIDAFIENLQAIAKSTIFNIGKDVYGLSATKAANAITDGLMTKALNSKSNCFSVASRLTSKQKSVIQKVTSKVIAGELKKCNETVFKLLTTPSRSAKLHRFECPVNVRVYDNAGNYCGGIINGQVDSLYHEVFATVNGEAKDFYTIGDDYYFVITGYDTGTMKYTVKEFDNKGEIRKLSYENVPINNSCIYYSMSPQAENLSNTYFDLTDGNGNVITPISGQDDSDIDSNSDYIITSGKCGTNVSYTLYKDGLLEITGKGDMDDYVQPENYDDYPSYYRNPWDKYKENIRQIIIGEGVTSIGANAFTNFDSVETVIMPESVKKLCVGAFSYCSGISSLIIPDSITEIQKSAFYGCEQLESVGISNSVSKIGRYTFKNCSSLSNVKIGNSVETICESAFENCPNITKIVIPSSVKYIESLAFYGCKIDCVDIQDLASWCDIKFYSESSNPLSCADHLCIKGEKITKLVIPTNVTEIKNYAFTGCKSITDLSIPNNVASIGSGAFCNCTSLINISIPDSVTEISDSLFSGCTSLISFTLPDSITKIGSSSFSQCTSLTDIVFPDKLTIIGRSSFYNCKNLKSVTIPPSVSKIDYNAFHDCTNIIDVKIYDINAWCSIDFAQYDSNPLYYSKNLFVKNTLSNNLIIPENISKIKDNAFYGFVGLKGITIPDSVTKIGKNSFYGCSSLEYIKTGNGIKNFDGFQFGLGNEYKELKEIIVGNSIESLEECMFYRCSQLKSIIIGNSINKVTRQSFDECTELEYITLPKNITRIENYAFSECENLKIISIPKNITNIDICAFNRCNNLHDIYYGGSKKQWDSININTGNECLLNANIHFSETIPADYSEIFLNKNSLSLEVGQTEYLIPFVFPDNAINNTITWSSSNTNIAIVDNGRVTGIKAGETTITAKTNNGKQAKCTVSIVKYLNPTVIANGKCGDNLTWALDSEGVLSISGTGDMYDYDFISSNNNYVPWKEYGEQINTVKINEGVTGIGSHAFQDYGLFQTRSDQDSIKEVSLPSTLLHIGEGAFLWCNSLKSITIPDSVTSIDKDAFARCKALSKVVLSNSLTEISEGVFWYCESLKTIDFPKNIKALGPLAFCDAGFETITIPNTIIELNWDSLSSLSLKEVIIEGDIVVDTSVFSGSRNLEKAVFYGNITFSEKHQPGSLFRDCFELKYLTIPSVFNYDGNELPIQSYANFYGCDNLEISNITFNDNPTLIDNVVYSEDGKTLLWYHKNLKSTNYTVPNGVEKIAYEAFMDNEYIEHILLPDTLKSLGVNTFMGCIKLNNVIIPDGVESLLDFQGCTSLRNIVIPSSVTAMYNHGKADLVTFQGIDELTVYCDKDSYARSFLSYYDTKDIVYCNFDANGGTVAKAKQAVIPSDKYWALPSATKQNAIFDGWYTAKTGGKRITENSIVNSESSFTLYAHWRDGDELFLGDVDSDGDVTIIDATFIQRKLASIPIPFEMNEATADTDGDGEITIIDATYIQKYLVSLPIPYEIGKPINT